MQIEALLDRTDFAQTAGLKDMEFQGYANAGLIPACLGFYNGQPLWKRADIAEFCARHQLPLAGEPSSVPHMAITNEPPASQVTTSDTPAPLDTPTVGWVDPTPAPAVPERVATMTIQQVCQRLGCSPATLAKRRELDLAPGFVKHSTRDIRYYADDVEAIYAEHGKLPRHYSADGLAAIKANTAKARAAIGTKGKAPKPFQYQKPPATPLLEPGNSGTVGQKTVISNAAVPLDDAAAHLGIDPLMLRILHKAGVGPKAASEQPLAYKMCDLNAYSTENGLQPGQIARPDKVYLDQRVRIPEASTITHLTQKALEHHRAKGTGPDWERQGIFSVYKRGDLYAWLVGKDMLAERAYDEQHRRAH